jgi:hypothetical protein
MINTLISGLTGPALIAGLLGGQGGGRLTLKQWFLMTGTWDNNGVWKDALQWPTQWFLMTGTWNNNGIWKDEIIL